MNRIRAVLAMALIGALIFMAAPAKALDLYTEEDVIKIAKTLYGECRSGAIPTAEKAAVVWCILNRVDSSRWPPTIDTVITRGQFHGYSAGNPVWPELYCIARDVLLRWELEKLGVGAVGRTLPAEYMFFAGSNGRNRFRTGRGGGYWDWSLPDPYEPVVQIAHDGRE